MEEEKSKVGYIMSKSVIDEFKALARKHAINKSRLVENFISDWIKQKKEQK